MSMPMMIFTLISACAVGALIQSVTGFGFGIFVMTLFPYFMPNYVASVTLSNSLSFMMCLYIAYQLRKSVNFKLLILPLIGYSITNAICVTLSVSQSETLLKRMLGVFLFVLSLYFIFFSHKVKIRPTNTNGFIAGTLSGVLSGLFGAGGPPVVIYFMSTTGSTLEYLATIQCYFLLSNSYNMLMRVINKLYTPQIVLFAFVGLIGVILGICLGKKVTGKVDDKLLKKLVYGFMSISGLIMLFTA